MGSVGVFGGSFNPIHCGHIELAKKVAKEFSLTRCYVIPTCTPPHKALAQGATNADRLNMIKIAFSDSEVIIGSDLEYLRGGVSYTYQTLRQLKQMHEGDRLYLIVGADMLKDLASWREPATILSLAEVIAVVRGGVDTTEFKKAGKKLSDDYNAVIDFADISVPCVSSTEIRERIASCRPIQGLTSYSVERYIYGHGLYMDSFFGAAIEKLRSRLDEERFLHVVSTMREASILAERYSLDARKAMIGGLLHDCAKVSDTDYIAEASKLGIDIDDEERQSPGLLHAKLSAYSAEHDFSVTDAEILNAIRHHTVGTEGMTDLEKAIFVADKIEAERGYLGIEELRSAARESLNLAMLLCIEQNIVDLKKKGRCIHKQTNAVCEYLRKQCDKYGNN